MSAWRRYVLIVALPVATASVILLLTGCDYFPKSMRAPSERVCRAFLQEIDMAKTNWAALERKTTNDAPTDAELFGPDAYLMRKPECPEGGIYTLGKVGEKPTCSKRGHKM